MRKFIVLHIFRKSVSHHVFRMFLLQNKHKKLKPGLVAFDDIWPRKRVYSQKKISKGVDK